jgi:hypothetical protein
MPYFAAICVAGSLLFVQGFFNEYAEVRLMVDPEGRHSFEGMNGMPASFPEWELYKLTGTVRGTKKNVPLVSTMCVVGDESAILLAYAPVRNAECDSSVSRPISGLSIWSMRPGKHKLEQAAFWNQLQHAQIYHAVTLVMGRRDLMELIPRLVQAGRFATVKDALTAIVNLYGEMVKKIRARYPGMRLFIGKVIVGQVEGILSGQKERVIELLRAILPEGVQALF